MLAPLHGLRAVVGCNRRVMLAKPRVRDGDRVAMLAAVEQGGTTQMFRYVRNCR
jgi:hypothetical protein